MEVNHNKYPNNVIFHNIMDEYCCRFAGHAMFSGMFSYSVTMQPCLLNMVVVTVLNMLYGAGQILSDLSVWTTPNLFSVHSL